MSINITGKNSIAEQLLAEELTKKGFKVANLREGKLPKAFEDSSDATAFMEQLGSMITAPVLINWAKETDNNFDTKTLVKLKSLNKAYDEFMSEMEKAQ